MTTKKYKLDYDKSSGIINIKKSIEVDGEEYSTTSNVTYIEAKEIFKYFYKEFYIGRVRRDECFCLDGAYDYCEVCSPNSFTNDVFKDELDKGDA